MSCRRVGVEEELLLVDRSSGVPRSVSRTALRAVRGTEVRDDEPDVEQELFLQQIETANAPCAELSALDAAIREGRGAAAAAAHAAGVDIAAVATPVIAGDAAVTPKGRYQRMVDRFGSIAREQMVCGMHVHVEIASDDEGIGAFDRIRPWLPVLLAVSSNSPYWDGVDTGHESYRAQVWSRWPSAGPTEAFDTGEAYHAAVRDLVDSEAALDEGMIYFDARLARSYPTVEIRVPDVCADVEDAVLVAALARALVETGAQQWRTGVPTPRWRTELLRGAAWHASKHGMQGQLLDPLSRELRPARDVLRRLVEYVGEALPGPGEHDLVAALVARLQRHGTGAQRQRTVYGERHDFVSVVRDVVDRTTESLAQGAGSSGEA